MTLNTHIATFTDTIASWDDIETAPHRFGGVEFLLNNVEVGHIHRHNGMVDIPYTRKIREQLVTEGQTGLHHLLQDSGWTTFYIRTEDDSRHAVYLMRLSYLQKRLARSRGNVALIDAIRTELDTLNLNLTLRQRLLGRHAI